MTRFSDRPTIHSIPARSRARRSRHTDGGMYDPDYEASITIEPSSEEPSLAQDQDIVQDDTQTESLVGAIDTDNTPGEPVSDELAAPQVDIVPPIPVMATVNGPCRASKSTRGSDIFSTEHSPCYRGHKPSADGRAPTGTSAHGSEPPWLSTDGRPSSAHGSPSARETTSDTCQCKHIEEYIT